MEEWDYAFDPEKNAWLIRERGISFEQIIALIESGRLMRVLEHPDARKYPDQLLYEVVRQGRSLFLKTIYPSRKATRKHSKGESE